MNGVAWVLLAVLWVLVLVWLYQRAALEDARQERPDNHHEIAKRLNANIRAARLRGEL
jgi:hypothetical protein